MEALTALSVASSVIQFVDFGSKLLSDSRKLYKSADGVLTENVDIEVITSDLLSLTQGLRRKLPENRPLRSSQTKSHEHSKDDEALDDLCKRCVCIAEELKRRLDKLKVEPDKVKRRGGKQCEGNENELTHPPPVIARRQTFAWAGGDENAEAARGMYFRKWHSFRKALEASWNKKEIEALAATLRDFKGEIEFRILVSFRGALNDLAARQSQTSQQYEHSTRLILDSFVNARDELANQLRVQAEKVLYLSESEKQGRKVEDRQHIENLVKGELDSVGMLQSPKGIKDPKDQPIEHSASDLQVEEEVRLLMIESGILQSLSFATLADRRESLEAPYNLTFEWIHEGPDIPRPWSNFSEWLRVGNGVYWINGKVGSGKSTLMRYIYDNEKTRLLLAEWADGMPSEISGFFFWNSGDEDQKSQSGLLRSLLFEILQRHRALLPVVMPEAWEAWSARATAVISHKLPPDSPFLPPEPKSLTLIQLKCVFRAVLETLQKTTRMCFFIDGLDEYEGDYHDIVSLFTEYVRSPNIKFCLSSRPLPVFEQAFGNMPSLKLQDLTYGDISHYVKHRLYSHKYLLQLSKKYPEKVSRLIDEIVTKARGVFLWVKLVVRSLLHGLSDYNRISDLEKRVRHLPEDLEALYAHMLKHTDRFYYEQASQIFQIFRIARKRSPDKLTLLNLSWAEDEDETLAETAPIKPLDHEEISMRCQIMDARLKSVCSGLLESIDSRFSDIAPNAKVLFLHRTVSDWLAKKEVWDELLSRTAGTGFSPNLSMLKSCVLQLKCMEVGPTLPVNMRVIFNALEYAKAAEADLNSPFPKLLDQLDIAASHQWRVGNGRGVPNNGDSDDQYDTCLSSSGESSGSSFIPQLMLSHRNRKVSLESLEHWIVPQEPLPIDSDSTTHHSLVENRPPTPGPAAKDDEGTEVEVYEDAISSLKEFAFSRLINAATSPVKDLRGKLSELHHATMRDIHGGALHHWSCWIEIPGIKPLGKPSTFYDIARYMGLSHYVAFKYDSGAIADQDVNQHLLMEAFSPTFGLANTLSKRPDPELVDRILEGGTDPNFSFSGSTPWEGAIAAAVAHFTSLNNPSGSQGHPLDSNWKEISEEWARVFEIFIRHNANPNVLKRYNQLPGCPKLSPLIVVESYFPEFLASKATELKMLLKAKGATDDLNLLNMTTAPDAEQRSDVGMDSESVTAKRPAPITMVRWMLSWFSS